VILHDLRPGGGESYSGGGGHSTGGGGSGGGAIFELIYWLIRMLFYYPQIAVPLLLLVIGYFVWSSYQQHRNRDWDSGPAADLEPAIELSDLRARDADFSQVVFEDFAFRLFAAAHRARPDHLAQVAPYVSQTARDELATREPTTTPITQVVVGALRAVRLDLDDPDGRARIAVEYEANLASAQHTYYSVETWLFARDATRHSKPPGASRDFPCPSCGAPWQATASGTQTCASCGQVVDNGRFDWVVEQVSLASQDERPPTLTTEVPERGTDLPTYRQPDLRARQTGLASDDPAFSEATLLARLQMIYAELNRAWPENKLAPVRGLVSDGLYDYLSYWTDAYARQSLRNVLVDMRITKTAIAKIERDRWYDAITIRIWGTGKDYVIRTETGRIVRGSKHVERAYSEYWTLVRSAARKGAARADAACANCGAPLHVGMAGECEHCGVHVTGGEFDWVVSKIEQDDSYRG